MRLICFVISYLLISLIKASSGSLNAKNESIDLLTFVKNKDNFNSNNTLQEKTSNANSSLHVQGCGGVLTSPNGIFTSPNFPDKYENYLECDWLIRVDPDKKIRLTFLEFSLEGCTFDVVEVYDGANDKAPLLGTFCGATVPNDLLSRSNQVLVRFKSDSSVTFQGFKASYRSSDISCGGVLNFSHGTFTSPNFPEKYDNNLDCEWLIRVQPDERIFLTFQEFHLESGSLGYCYHDVVEVYDGENRTAPLLGSFCGPIVPSHLLSSTNVLLVRFKSDSSVTYKGFKIEYHTNCGGIFTEPSGTLTSPNYPNNYPPNAQCIYEIRLQPGNLVNLTFKSMDIESHSQCLFDYLQIRDGDSKNSPLKAQLCGNTVPEPIISTTNFLWMKFVTDISSQYQGFYAIYNTIENGCGGVYTAPSGNLTSPNYPDNYPPNTQCIYEIQLEPGNLIQITFHAMEIEGQYNCYNDYLQVRDGDNENSPLIAKLCGTTLPEPIISTANFLWMKFKTDHSLQYQGFYASYNTIENGCGGVYTKPSGILTSPNYPNNYPPNAQCIYKIRLEPGKFVNITFYKMEIETHSECSFDYLQIRDGDREDSPLIAQLCGTTVPKPIISTTNSLWMKFGSDDQWQYHGFYAIYHAIENDFRGCGGLLTSPNGTFTSPNFPNNYENNQECGWLIQVHPDERILLTFLEFHLESHENCLFDSVEVYDGSDNKSQLLGRFCGTTIPSDLFSQTNQLFVRFKSDSTGTFKGFKAEYRTTFQECGGVLTSPNGTFTSPNFPDDYDNNVVCEWLIRVKPDKRISLSFQEFQLESGGFNCMFDFVEVYDGANDAAQLLGRFCGGIKPNTLSSKSNQLLVRFKSDFSNSYKGFKAEYKAANCDCGHNGNCSFTYSGEKNCHCNKGYSDRNGFCSFCDCGPHGRCSFNYRGAKTCYCDYGYVFRNDFCSGYIKDEMNTDSKGWQIATYVCAVLISIIIIGMLIMIVTKSCT